MFSCDFYAVMISFSSWLLQLNCVDSHWLLELQRRMGSQWRWIQLSIAFSPYVELDFESLMKMFKQLFFFNFHKAIVVTCPQVLANSSFWKYVIFLDVLACLQSLWQACRLHQNIWMDQTGYMRQLYSVWALAALFSKNQIGWNCCYDFYEKTLQSNFSGSLLKWSVIRS